jgi:ketosteroid isomerase-like protein
MALYDTNAVEMPPDQPLLKGKAAIEQYYKKLFGDPNMKVTSFVLDHIESTVSGDVAYDVGTYKQTMMASGKSMNETGKYVVLMRKVGTDWKVTCAIYNSDMAMPHEH